MISVFKVVEKIVKFSDVHEDLDISDVLNKKNIFALKYIGNLMIDTFIADGSTVLMERVEDQFSLKYGQNCK